MTDTPEKIIRETITRLLARREHSYRELTEKCIARGFERQLVVKVLAWFQSHDLQSEDRFAQSLSRSRAQRGYGPQRIRAELREHDIPAEMAENALASSDVDWFEMARETGKRKFGDRPSEDWQTQQKKKRYLHYRGYDSEQIRYALGEDD